MGVRGSRGERRDQGCRTENAVSAPCSGGSDEASPAAFIDGTSSPEDVVSSAPDVRIGKGPRMPWLGQTAGRHMLYHKPGSHAEGTKPASVSMATSGAGRAASSSAQSLAWGKRSLDGDLGMVTSLDWRLSYSPPFIWGFVYPFIS